MGKPKSRPPAETRREPPRRPVSILGGSGGGFVTEYVHHWTRKLMRARDYGYKAWPFGYRKRG